MEKRLNYLQSLMTKELWQEAEAQYRYKFEKYATHMGNGIYQWRGLYSTDTAELWLMGILSIKKVAYEQN